MTMLSTVLRQAKEGIYRARLQARRLTAGHRALPDFMVLGAQKAGTTSLYAYLTQHPEVLPSLAKEIHYFDGGLDPRTDNYRKGERWYRSHFPLAARRGGHFKTGEASPLYLFNPLAPQRISDLLPEVKLIALLRNPVERAISHYFHEKRGGREPLPILEAFQAEEGRLAPVLERNDYKSGVFINCSYKKRGIYHEQLQRYYQRFSREQLCIMSDDEFFGDTRRALSILLEFIGVDPRRQIKNLSARNVGSNKSKPAPEVHEYLRAYFLPHNEALYALIGRKLTW